MESNTNYILIINGGSSSIKFALYEMDMHLRQIVNGSIERIRTKDASLDFTYTLDKKKNQMPVDGSDIQTAGLQLIHWLESRSLLSAVTVIGHRVVHGMQHTKPREVTDILLDELKKISCYDPEHLPGEIQLIELFRENYPDVIQIVCFDTAFHTSMPTVAKILPIPRKYYTKGIQRYGFHGLSYSYLPQELERITDHETARGKIVMAHLGSGASVTAILNGISIDTSMGFTPASGLPMSTRTGDLDPGVAWYLMQNEKMNADEFSQLINHQSGLLGESETKSDMRELLKIKDADARAADAINLFCYQTKKMIGSFAAVLGGIDTLVFSGGIGENIPEIRKLICTDLGFIGIEMDEKKNQNNNLVISPSHGKTNVMVIKTDEELMIAKLVYEVLLHTKN